MKMYECVIGDKESASAGEQGVAAAGEEGSATAGEEGVAAAGHKGSAAANDWGSAAAGKQCGIVDDKKIKADTWYKCVNGKLVEA